MTVHASGSRISAAWQQAARLLHIEVIAPYELAGVRFPAYLPEFGGPRGMVIAQLGSSEQSEQVETAASDYGLFRVSPRPMQSSTASSSGRHWMTGAGTARMTDVRPGTPDAPGVIEQASAHGAPLNVGSCRRRCPVPPMCRITVRRDRTPSCTGQARVALTERATWPTGIGRARDGSSD